MAISTQPESSLEHIRSADRLARAASRWLRLEQAPGTPFPAPGPAHRDLLAGLVAGLGDWLAVDPAILPIAAYSLALLEHERDGAVDTPPRVRGQGPLSPDYLEGLRIAERLATALGNGQAPPPA
ncbi:MAG: hypothetical protein JSV45_03165 [Chromatiales bacterium]|nr:MAG: hypothetical protein JSV45_03165 [Chromatiales bacterium]